MHSPLFSPFRMGTVSLANRVVMAPMTRSRALGNVPNELMAEYYAQRATAGLIITEGVSPSPNGLGYARIPGIFSAEQTAAWKQVTDRVHAQGGKIFVQIMHTGRVGHGLNLPAGARVFAPSAVRAEGDMWTDEQGMQPHPIPQEMTLQDIAATQQEYVHAANNAIAAGFDGIELHAANGYLLEQFISPFSNQRTDAYGGTFEKRNRFVIEVAELVSEAIGADKVGIRLSPYGVFNDMPLYDEIDAAYTHLAGKLNETGIAYVHLVDHSSQGAPEVPVAIKRAIRAAFTNTLILSGGYDLDRATEDLQNEAADLIAFGKPFITNPDLVERLSKNLELNTNLDSATLYTPGAKGYTDYPVYEEHLLSAGR